MKFLDRFRNQNVYAFFDSDLDGIGSRIVYHYYIEPLVKRGFITNSSQRDMSDFNQDYSDKSDVILFTDIAPTVELYNKLISEGKEVIICDHHDTSYRDLQECNIPEENYFYSTTDCGCMILFKNCSQERRIQKCVFQFVELVNTYDTWQENSSLWPEAKKLNNTLWGSINWFDDKSDTDRANTFIERQLLKFSKGKYFYFTNYEEELHQKAFLKEKSNLSEAKRTLSIREDNSLNKYGYFECNSKLSFVASTLLKEYPYLDYICGYSTFSSKVKNEPTTNVSLRSREPFDVSLIAKKYGGGGHPQASGVELPEDIFKDLRKGKIHLI